MSNPIQSLYAWYRRMIRHPQYRWWIILGTLVYVLSPIDISPDVFPIAGQIDDVAIMVILLSEVSSLIVERLKAQQTPVSETEPTASKSDKTVDVDAVSVD